MEIQEPVSCEQLKCIFSIRSSLRHHKEATLFLNELSPCHFLTSEIFVKILSLKSLTAYHPKNRKIFRLSHNLTKIFWVTRFRETNLTAKSVSSSEILKISDFQLKLPFYPFSKKINFSGVSHQRDPRI